MKLLTTVLTFLLSLLSVLSTDVKVGSVRVGYYTGWDNFTYTPSDIDYTKLTHINYAFLDFDPNTFTPVITNPNNLKEVIRLAHAKSCKVLVSVGGWLLSKNFSPMVAKKESRAQFIDQFNNMLQKYSLDGIDFDWEFPGQEGDGNKFDLTNDTNNFLELLKELRSSINTKLITAAVSVTPFQNKDGPIKDTTEFAKVFDFINIMSYDIHGPWTNTTGPVGGLDFETGKGVQMSVKGTLKTWEASGFPKNKLVIGVPFYAYGWQINSYGQITTQYNKVVKSLNTTTFAELITKSILKSPSEANSEAGWVRYFDKVTNTPWVYNKQKNELYTYDDPKSLKIKSNYVKCNGYLGTMIWALSQDYKQNLLDSLQGEVSSEICKDITNGSGSEITSSYQDNRPTSIPISSEATKTTPTSSFIVTSDAITFSYVVTSTPASNWYSTQLTSHIDQTTSINSPISKSTTLSEDIPSGYPVANPTATSIIPSHTGYLINGY